MLEIEECDNMNVKKARNVLVIAALVALCAIFPLNLLPEGMGRVIIGDSLMFAFIGLLLSAIACNELNERR